jgi:hypothetical protein
VNYVYELPVKPIDGREPDLQKAWEAAREAIEKVVVANTKRQANRWAFDYRYNDGIIDWMDHFPSTRDTLFYAFHLWHSPAAIVYEPAAAVWQHWYDLAVALRPKPIDKALRAHGLELLPPRDLLAVLRLGVPVVFVLDGRAPIVVESCRSARANEVPTACHPQLWDRRDEESIKLWEGPMLDVVRNEIEVAYLTGRCCCEGCQKARATHDATGAIDAAVVRRARDLLFADPAARALADTACGEIAGDALLVLADWLESKGAQIPLPVLPALIESVCRSL